LTLDSNSG